MHNIAMEKIALTGGKIFTADDVLEKKALLVDQGIIVGIVAENDLPEGYQAIMETVWTCILRNLVWPRYSVLPMD
jgi:N-acetylglucosamine-6-phosphate deacetylase